MPIAKIRTFGSYKSPNKKVTTEHKNSGTNSCQRQKINVSGPSRNMIGEVACLLTLYVALRTEQEGHGLGVLMILVNI